MDIRKLQRAVVDALEDVKAQDIKVFNTTEQTSLFDRVVIASGTSNRQTRALASSVEDKARELGIKMIAREGDETGEWMLVDLGDVVVHIMQPAIREYYNLEEIWGSSPVRMKIGPEVSSVKGRTSIKTVTKKVAKKVAKQAAKAVAKKVVKKVANKATKSPASKTGKVAAKQVTPQAKAVKISSKVAKKVADKVVAKAVVKKVASTVAKKAAAKKATKTALKIASKSATRAVASKKSARKTPSQAS